MKLEKDTNDIFDYDSKYNNDEIIKETFPEIEIKLKDELTNTTKKIYKYFDLK
jgi:D-alanine-D-alanine ligase-like ATP-grasp enzyme